MASPPSSMQQAARTALMDHGGDQPGVTKKGGDRVIGELIRITSTYGNPEFPRDYSYTSAGNGLQGTAH